MAWGTRHSRYSGVVDFNRFRFTRLAIAEAFHLTNRYALRMTFTVNTVYHSGLADSVLSASVLHLRQGTPNPQTIR